MIFAISSTSSIGLLSIQEIIGLTSFPELSKKWEQHRCAERAREAIALGSMPEEVIPSLQASIMLFTTRSAS